MRSLQYMLRVMLALCFGVWRVRVRDLREKQCICNSRHPHSPDDCLHPLVANHLGYLDGIILTSRGYSFVVKRSALMPAAVVSSAKALNFLFVTDRTTDAIVSRITQTLASHHKSATRCRGCALCFTTFSAFPEGTTANGTSLAKFRSGVFVPGVAVHPVAIRFPHAHFNPSWDSIPVAEHLFRMLTRFVSHVEFTFLPLYIPTMEKVRSKGICAECPKSYSRDIAHSDHQPE
eukprot:991113_1